MALDPDPRGDLHAGVIAAAVLSTVPRKGKAPQPWDLFPTLGAPRRRRRRKRTAAEVLEMLTALTLAAGGQVVRNNG